MINIRAVKRLVKCHEPKLILVPHHKHFIFKNYNIFVGHNSEAKLN